MPAIESRLLVTFINKFIVDSVDLLNGLCVTADQKMMRISRRISRIEDSLGNENLFI